MKIDGNFIVRQKSDTIHQKIDLKSQVFEISTQNQEKLISKTKFLELR